MSKKFFKKVAAMVAAMTMAVSTMAVSASANEKEFNLRFVRGAPASVNSPSNNLTITATGAPSATLVCDSFTTDAPGAIGRGDSYENYDIYHNLRYETSDVTFYYSCTQYMRYQGEDIPNYGTSVQFRVNIEGYSNGNYVYALGSVKG